MSICATKEATRDQNQGRGSSSSLIISMLQHMQIKASSFIGLNSTTIKDYQTPSEAETPQNSSHVSTAPLCGEVANKAIIAQMTSEDLLKAFSALVPRACAHGCQVGESNSMSL